MKDFIDQTSQQEGTPINRESMMAVQGFVANAISYDNGKIIKTNSNGHYSEIFASGVFNVVEKFVGDKTITKTTSYADGDWTVVIS